MAESLVGAYTMKGHDGRALRVFIVRFNPDERDQERAVVRLEDRLKAVCAHVRALLAGSLDHFLPALPHVWYYYYHSKCADKIAHAQAGAGLQVQGVVE